MEHVEEFYASLCTEAKTLKKYEPQMSILSDDFKIKKKSTNVNF